MSNVCINLGQINYKNYKHPSDFDLFNRWELVTFSKDLGVGRSNLLDLLLDIKA